MGFLSRLMDVVDPRHREDRKERKRQPVIGDSFRSFAVIDRLLQPVSLSARMRLHKRKKFLRFCKSDVIVLRYPKSGVTWLRVLISYIYQHRCGTPKNEVIGSELFNEMCPESPRFFFAIDNIDDRLTEKIVAAVGRKKTILLLRDPRDVTVSMYYHFWKRSTPLERARFAIPAGFETAGIHTFVMNQTYGMPRVIAFMNRWWDTIDGAADTLVVRYEDLHANAAPVLKEIMSFIGTPANDHEIREAVGFAAFDQMKQRERNGAFRSAILRPTDPADENSYKVRKAKVGGYSEHFTADQLAQINALLRATLNPRIGYA